MRFSFSHFAVVLLLIAAVAQVDSLRAEDFMVGADLSFLKREEDQGTVFKDAGQAKPGLQIFKDHGYNWIRLRLFHTPTELPNDLQYTVTMAKEAKKLGYKFLLDLHYSDTWADPSKQFMPKAWEGKSNEELEEAIENYTRWAVTEFREAGAAPDMVQIGNETVSGMLWPNGKLPDHWDVFCNFVKAGVRGVQAASDKKTKPRIMIHICFGNKGKIKYYLDKLVAANVPFDVVGLSYYPWWHGPMKDLKENLRFMAVEYKKDVVVVEAGYCWRPTEYTRKTGPFPETPEGQKEFWEQVTKIVRETPDGRGLGVFWWEPAVMGPLKNRSFFDEANNALPAISVFDRKKEDLQ